MSVQLYSHSKSDLEKAVEIILSKAKQFRLPIETSEEKPEDLISQNDAAKFLHISMPTIIVTVAQPFNFPIFPKI